MRCDDAKEFVSAMHDGEAVPSEAADHIHGCTTCRELLKGYADVGAKLRSYGSVLIAEPVPDRMWLTTKTDETKWWEKGLQMMRIPRIAFASLVLLLVVLGSRLTLVEVRAHEDGSVLMLKLTPALGDSIQCFVPIADANHSHCKGLAQIDKSNLFYGIRALKKDGDRVLLSIRSRVAPLGPAGFGPDTESSLPEVQSWFTPGESLMVSGTGDLKLALTGQWTDHIPVSVGSDQLLDPGPNEIRLTSPLLLKNDKVAGDIASASAIADKSGEGVLLYIPGEGRFILSPVPIEGAIQTKVELNRVSFESNGQRYVIVTGTPISRGESIWVRHDIGFKPAPNTMEGPSVDAGPVSKLF